MYELPLTKIEITKIKTEAYKELVEQLKEYFREKVIEAFGDMADGIEYLTIDIEQTEIDINNILKELVDKADDSTTNN